MPIPAAAIAVIIAEKAAEKLGERLGEAISDSIFGKDSQLPDIQKELRKMSQKLEEILSYSRATFVLVERLPIVMQEKLDLHELYQAHNNINSTYEAYEAFLTIQEWNEAISFGPEIALRNNWKTIIDTEARIEMLMALPKYGDFLLVFTRGKLRDSVLSGIDKKIEELAILIKLLSDEKVTPCAQSMERIIHSAQVKSGSLLDEKPWVSWVLNDPLTKIIKVCRPSDFDSNGPGGRGRDRMICHQETVPDSVWNSSLASADAELKELSERMEGLRKILQAAVITHKTLVTYRNSIAARA